VPTRNEVPGRRGGKKKTMKREKERSAQVISSLKKRLSLRRGGTRPKILYSSLISAEKKEVKEKASDNKAKQTGVKCSKI